jgi:PKD repeat protein
MQESGVGCWALTITVILTIVAMSAGTWAPAIHGVGAHAQPTTPSAVEAVSRGLASWGSRQAASTGPYEGVAAYADETGTFAGVSTTIDVTTPTIPSPGLGYYAWDAFGVFTTTTGADTLEFGYIEVRGDVSTWGPYPFYVNTTDYLQVVCGPGALTTGPHEFSAAVVTGTNEWEFAVDGSAMAGTTFGWGSIASCDGPTVTGELLLNSSLAYEDAMANYAWEVDDNPSQGLWTMPSVTFPVAFSIYSGGSWQSVQVGLATGYNSSGAAPSYGIEGQHQDSALSSDEFIVGSTIPWPGTEAVLWAPALQVVASVTARVGDVPFTVSFSASASGGTGTYDWYNWTFGDTQTGQGTSLEHTYSATGTYSATVQVTDSGGEHTSSTPILVTVDTDPGVAVAPVSTSVLQGQSLTLTATASGGASPYTYSWWDLPPGCSNTTAPVLSCTPSGAGTFNIRITVTDANGFSVSSTATVTVRASFVGLPAVEGYEVVGGGIAAVAIVAAVTGVLLLRRRKGRQSPPQPPLQAPQVTPPPPTGPSG